MAVEPSPSPRLHAAGVQAVIFDFDGTLFDSFDGIVHAFNAALSRHGRPGLPRERIAALIGRPLADMLQAALPDVAPEDVTALVATYREEFRPVCLSMSRLLPGVRETLHALREAHLRTGILTNRMGRGAHQMLDGFEMTSLFDAVLCLGETPRPKPDPSGLLELLHRFDCPPAAAFMVGDAPVDIETGRNAGVRTVGITTGSYTRADLERAGADVIIARMDELRSAVL